MKANCKTNTILFIDFYRICYGKSVPLMFSFHDTNQKIAYFTREPRGEICNSYLNLTIKLVLVNKMAQKVSSERIERDDGYLYYLGKDGYVWKTPMKMNTRGRKAKVGSEKISREDGFLYYIDGNGYVVRTKMNRGGRARGSGAKRKAASSRKPARKAMKSKKAKSSAKKRRR
jgi:hypothetical protein